VKFEANIKTWNEISNGEIQKMLQGSEIEVSSEPNELLVAMSNLVNTDYNRKQLAQLLNVTYVESIEMKII
jgi:hypothetical protein